MSDTKHTPTPWKKFVAGSEGVYIFPDSGDKREDLKFVAIVNGRSLLVDQANAAFIVRACNNFDALLEACKMALGAFERNDCIDWNVLAQAIAAAERENEKEKMNENL